MSRQNAHPLICEARIFTSSIKQGSSFEDLRMNISRLSIALYAAGEVFCASSLCCMIGFLYNSTYLLFGPLGRSVIHTMSGPLTKVSRVEQCEAISFASITV